MSADEIKHLVWTLALEYAQKGSGWAQEGVVMREVRNRLFAQGRPDTATQQAILEAWQDLFIEKRLAWGFDLDNPNSPFFHVRKAG